jgi:hypothetical protein
MEVRDPAKPRDYYAQLVKDAEAEIGQYTKFNNPALLGFACPACIRIGKTLYSQGDSVSACLHWCEQAVSYHMRFVVEGRKYQFNGYGVIDQDLELYSAGYLVGRAPEMLECFQRTTFKEPIQPVQKALLDQLFSTLTSRPLSELPLELKTMTGPNEEWATLPPLFKAIADKNEPAFALALQDYLMASWSPAVEKWAKRALKSARPEYFGKWNLFAAAVCKIMGSVPQLPKKLKQYLPVDLTDR